MNETYTYKVADLFFSLTLPQNLATPEILDRYKPFQVTTPVERPAFKLQVIQISSFKEKLASHQMRRYNDESPYIWLDVNGEALSAVGFQDYRGGIGSIVEPSTEKDTFMLYLPEDPDTRDVMFQINNALMLGYMIGSNQMEHLMIHASVIVLDKKAYIFLGRSGTGKSTHARMWLNYIKGSRLLNDDNPIVYIKDGRAYVSGSPWSGKTPCYINEEYPLCGIVRLSQAPHNIIKELKGIQAYAAFFPSCSCTKWDKAAEIKGSKTVEKVVMQVPVYHLECKPDEEAALTCFNKVHKC